MDIVDKLKREYGANTPILLDDIKSVMGEYSTPYVFRCIKEATVEGKLARFDDAVYYLPTETILGQSTLNPYAVIERKYIRDGSQINGFYSGWALFNAIGGTRQVPSVIEVVTNIETMKVHETIVGKQRLILRKPKCKITDSNEKILQILELANYIELNREGSLAVLDYARKRSITVKELLQYAKYYPAKTLKNIREVLYELA